VGNFDRNRSPQVRKEPTGDVREVAPVFSGPIVGRNTARRCRFLSPFGRFPKSGERLHFDMVRLCTRRMANEYALKMLAR
jgi:hypothetical protein